MGLTDNNNCFREILYGITGYAAIRDIIKNVRIDSSKHCWHFWRKKFVGGLCNNCFVKVCID